MYVIACNTNIPWSFFKDQMDLITYIDLIFSRNWMIGTVLNYCLAYKIDLDSRQIPINGL